MEKQKNSRQHKDINLILHSLCPVAKIGTKFSRTPEKNLLFFLSLENHPKSSIFATHSAQISKKGKVKSIKHGDIDFLLLTFPF
jgi:hypothetical protein